MSDPVQNRIALATSAAEAHARKGMSAGMPKVTLYCSDVQHLLKRIEELERTKPIRTEQDYEAALARIDALMDAETGSAEFDELDVLADLVELYEESKKEPYQPPATDTPSEAIKGETE